ncbi:YqiJ family protein [Terasakiella sp. A23]|uniref:YqiJ family protein n=1 Tax=Terasakiella sp. FCG-A23 TaxID=3080561 RepID=UPI002954B7AA|nr:YqiJ family protein [Terasakiella sp. A23]MDV7340474.1 YqiJ family protein [Terasakiella sp. A23]
MVFLSYFNDAANFPFSVALFVVTILAALEGVGLLVGVGIFSFLDALLPDVDLEVDVDAPDFSDPSILGSSLTWLRIDRVPVIISLIVFLVSFGLIGLSLQGMVKSVFGSPLPVLIAMIPTTLLALPVLSVGNTILSKIIPQDETSAVSQDSLIGKMAEITLGEAKKDFPAQAKVKDEYDQTHYIMICPDNDHETFTQGSRLLLVRRDNTTYFGIQNTSDALSDE